MPDSIDVRTFAAVDSAGVRTFAFIEMSAPSTARIEAADPH
jgi:hypothetical protein